MEPPCARRYARRAGCEWVTDVPDLLAERGARPACDWSVSTRPSSWATSWPHPDNHILGGHLGAQALMAAGQTAPGRPPHSMHTYFLRPGDARRPRRLRGGELQEGRTFSARRVTARQDGEVLLEAMSSFIRRRIASNRCRVPAADARGPRAGDTALRGAAFRRIRSGRRRASGPACGGTSGGSSTPPGCHPPGRGSGGVPTARCPTTRCCTPA